MENAACPALYYFRNKMRFSRCMGARDKKMPVFTLKTTDFKTQQSWISVFLTETQFDYTIRFSKNIVLHNISQITA